MSMLTSLSNFAEKTILQNSLKISAKVPLGCIFMYVKFDQDLSFSFPILAPRVGLNALLLCNPMVVIKNLICNIVSKCVLFLDEIS